MAFRARWVASIAAAVTTLVVASALAAPGGPSIGAAGPPPAEVADPLSIYVLTFGPGDHPFLKFGHDALWVRDRAAGTDRVYNFGTFAFDSPRLIFDFLKGRLTYWLSVSTMPITLAEYERADRSIVAQELRLDAAAKSALRARLDVNARPENRAYKYDYFLDNCATRVRDAVDLAAGGQLRAAARGPARLTLRGQALRLTADYLPLYVALDLILGPAVDRPVDRWAEMYIPEELQRGLDETLVGTPLAPGPLVATEATLFTPSRPAPREAPPAWIAWFFACGLAVGAVFAGLGAAAGRVPRGRVRAAARLLLGFALTAWGLVVGFVGCFLVYAWAFTDHVVAHRNQNILLTAPWALAFLALGPGVAAGSPRARRAAATLAAAAVAAVLAALCLKLGLAHHQENGRLVAFSLPAWSGIALSLALARNVQARP
jgi:uncharacterized protein DUF4105